MTADTYDDAMFNRSNVKYLVGWVGVSIAMWVVIIWLLDKLWDQFT